MKLSYLRSSVYPSDDIKATICVVYLKRAEWDFGGSESLLAVDGILEKRKRIKSMNSDDEIESKLASESDFGYPIIWSWR